MPPQLASLICILFILYLFWMDRKKSDGPSRAIWIPLIWMFLAGSRYVSSWLNVGAPMTSVDAYAEGSPVDAAAYSLLIAAGVFVLLRRRLDWGRWLTQNKWIWLYFLYCGISIIWSDYPFVCFKRWIKELGNPIMVLVILTENRPYEAAGVILRRLGFLWLPLSVLFIRYYPDMGRGYTPEGVQMLTGIGHQKNDLGLMCLLSGIYFAWNFLLIGKGDIKLEGRGNITDFILITMVVWLLHKSQSSTSLACLVVAASLFFMGRTTLIAQNPGRIIVLLVAVVSLFVVLDATLDVRNVVFEILGRDATLTNRVQVWEEVKGMATNPIVGAGFMSFWTGQRMEMLWEKIGVTISQAHNGYLEQYLNLGYIGVAFIGVIMLSGLIKIRRHLNLDYPSAMLRLCFIVSAVLYNYTEASFYGLNNMWVLTLLGIIEVSDRKRLISKVED